MANKKTNGSVAQNEIISNINDKELVELIKSIKLTNDVKSETAKIATNPSKKEIKILVDLYYQVQDYRKSMREQIRSIEQGKDDGTATNVQLLDWIMKNMVIIEKGVGDALEIIVENNEVGRWLIKNVGIGHVLAAGLLGYFDVKGRQYATQFHSYAGLNDNNRPWLGQEKSKKIVEEVLGSRKKITDDDVIKIAALTQWKVDYLRKACIDKKTGEVKYTKTKLVNACAKIPYNKGLKTHMHKVAQSFVYQSSRGSYYGQLYQQKKADIIRKNELGEYAEQAAKYLASKNYSKGTKTYEAYINGKLPDAQITARAMRWVEKIFVSHLFEEMYRVEYDDVPPRYYILEHSEKDSSIVDGNPEHNREIPPEVPYTLVSKEKTVSL